MVLREYFKRSQFANIFEAVENETIVKSGLWKQSYQEVLNKLENDEPLDQADLLMVIRALEGELSHLYSKLSLLAEM